MLTSSFAVNVASILTTSSTGAGSTSETTVVPDNSSFHLSERQDRSSLKKLLKVVINHTFEGCHLYPYIYWIQLLKMCVNDGMPPAFADFEGFYESEADNFLYPVEFLFNRIDVRMFNAHDYMSPVIMSSSNLKNEMKIFKL
ncbi:hypothetical protein Pint_28849 [Pistacia integerrima]|uniref:Uncharacterized protein n=1 Tax=Pistacia integerrima TaxID=434235 RepID=A0ACC0X2F1_9ROSI|nr:hypothetical protein Pint_28849 [Pistacia integerrima]